MTDAIIDGLARNYAAASLIWNHREEFEKLRMENIEQLKHFYVEIKEGEA